MQVRYCSTINNTLCWYSSPNVFKSFSQSVRLMVRPRPSPTAGQCTCNSSRHHKLRSNQTEVSCRKGRCRVPYRRAASWPFRRLFASWLPLRDTNENLKWGQQYKPRLSFEEKACCKLEGAIAPTSYPGDTS